jgi:hypothetical protein
MSNKSEATWHPNSGPVADLDATLTRIDRLKDERDKARAERDALAHVLSLVRDSVVETDDGFFGTDDETLVAALDTAPTVSLARHDAEVKAQALDEASHALWVEHGGPVRRSLRERAAAIRAEANDHSN